MRISKSKLFGLAVAVAGAAAGSAAADDLTVSTATTTPLSTSSPAGGTAGDITVASGGSIEVNANQTAITVDSNNDVSNAGTLRSNDDNNVTGILLNGGFAGTVANTGAISLVEDYTLADTDNDGNLDGEYAVGTGRVGIHVVGASPFTGDITSSGSIVVEGNNSALILLDGALAGDLTVSGTHTITGDNSVGVGINGGVTGDVKLGGTISARGEGSTGVLLNSDVTGALTIAGSVTTTGYHSTTRPLTDTAIAALDPDDLLQGGSAVDIRGSVTQGVTVAGVGVEDDLDDDGDGISEDTDGDGVFETGDDSDDDLSATIATYGAAPAISISPDGTSPQNIVLGATASGYGFNNRGTVAASGVYDGVNATAVRVQGNAGSTVSITGGILNDGGVTSEAREADAFGYYIGDGATVPAFVTRRSIQVRTVSSDSAQEAVAVNVASGATVNSFNNSGVIVAQADGNTSDAVAIRDQSNTLSSITNSGRIQTLVNATDSTAAVTGETIAIDVSTSTIGVTYNQIADIPFTDQDSVDNDSGSRPAVSLIGDVRFGQGADTVNLLAGTITGDIAFGAGADTMTIDNGAVFNGAINDSDGALTLNVANGALNLGAGQLDLTSATFGADSNLGVLLATDPADASRIIASGAVTFVDGAKITPSLPGELPSTGTIVFLTANGGLNGEEFVVGEVTDGTPFVYNLDIQVADGDANSLAATYSLKSATELGLNANETAALSPIIAGLQQNDAAGAAFAGLLTQPDFIAAYQDLLPNYSSAITELTTTAVQQQQSASSNRLATARLHGARDRSFWAQEIGYGLTRDPSAATAAEYRGFGFGFAGGLDRPVGENSIAGVSISFVSSQMEEPHREDGEITSSLGQLNGYYGTSFGNVNLDLVAGAGVGKLKSRRFVQIGDDFSAISEGEWWAYEGHGMARVSSPFEFGRFSLTPSGALTYVALNEQDYTEEGGGVGIDYEVDSAFTQRLWGDVGMELAAVFGNGADARSNVFMPRLFVGYRANLIDDASDRTFRSAGSTTEFSLADTDYGDGGALAGLGFTAGNSFSTFSLGYEGEFGDEITRHSLNASVRIRF